jgi:hypothetical protein
MRIPLTENIREIFKLQFNVLCGMQDVKGLILIYLDSNFIYNK